MGVNGLWTVIQPCARPTNLATLNQKRLAVDASIWIYQFLKAVRDKEGNALRNSHVVGFFRRICKLLWFGIRPVFVFDGGAPALKRQTITSRKRRREGRREDAVRTAGKLLAVQMQRIAEEEDDKRKRQRELERQGGARPEVVEPAEEIPDAENLVYVDEVGMSQQERQKNRKFFKQDAYHLPDMHTSIEGMGKPDDPRIMSISELEEYARQFNSGEDINLYDFSKIDFDGEFFKSLPPADRYNILNAARVRSRLRMGLSKEQLEEMFPNRMDFSRFQIERVQERNRLTQRLMKEAGMTGLDLTVNGAARIAGEKDREYILVKNDGVEGGWALGVVSKEKDVGQIHKPIDVDALEFQYQKKEDEDEWEDDGDFEDVPIEGVNRLPKIPSHVREAAERRQQFYESRREDHGIELPMEDEDEDSLFVQDPSKSIDSLFEADEEEDLNRAIAMSMKNQHHAESARGEDEDEEFEDVPAPVWKQKAVEQAKPVTSSSGSMIAHIVNNRANASVRKRRRSQSEESDGEMDLSAALSKAKKKKTVPPMKPVAAPTFPNKPNPFGGPLPFEKLDWKSSIFAKKPEPPKPSTDGAKTGQTSADELAGGFVVDDDDDMVGGFERSEDQEDVDDEAPRPLPPWMEQEETDIRESMKTQREREKEINEEDREAALAAERRRQKDAVIEIESDEDDSDVEVIDAPPPKTAQEKSRLSPATMTRVNPPAPDPQALQDDQSMPANEFDGKVGNGENTANDQEHQEKSASRQPSSSPDPDFEFEEVDILGPQEDAAEPETRQSESLEPVFEEVDVAVPTDQPTSPQVAAATEPAAQDAPSTTEIAGTSAKVVVDENGDIFIDDNEVEAEEEEQYSDPEDEELLAQMAEEAEEHARFASQLNNKSEKENIEAYEKELKALRTQQKKDRRDADEVTQIMITECQALLRFFGIPYITAPMEAEAQCAELVNMGLVDGIVTDDSDIFLFGGTRVYKNMFNSNKLVECYLGSDLEKELSLSREQLIALAQLLGSDYTEGLPGVGPVTAVEILSEFPGHEGLEAFRDWWKEVQLENRPKEADAVSSFRKKFRKSQATKLFLPLGFPNPAVREAYVKPEVDSDPEPFQWGVPDVEGLRRFLMSTIGWSPERTDEVLVPVIRDMNRREAEGTQSTITRFFDGSVGVGAKEAFAPRQRTQTSKRMVNAVNRLRANVAVDGQSEEAPVEVAPAAGRKRKTRGNAPAVENDGGEEAGPAADDDGHDEDDEDGAAKEPARPKKGGRGRKSKN
ncbi:DNA excision repair protein [Pestalotiopsis sp. NC0098]|nr:DNA excision repair protein [Pestalotiopsis sp. NC0098]